MSLHIHRKANFRKSLETLARGDKTASLAASRAEEIIEKLASGDYQAIEIVSRRTKHGELRINGCRKYNLGAGYRLICVKHEGYLVATYVGSHDDCNRWIENNRGFELELPSLSDSLMVSENRESNRHRDSENEEHEPDYDDILMAKIDQRVLRQVFCGLCGGS
ncbi:MAG: hypothetical protein LJE96_00335 [Deltaproteobacteria bacterium]|nr:hypothetical protein [Deltaproteobacteria bacterium]